MSQPASENTTPATALLKPEDVARFVQHRDSLANTSYVPFVLTAIGVIVGWMSFVTHAWGFFFLAAAFVALGVFVDRTFHLARRRMVEFREHLATVLRSKGVLGAAAVSAFIEQPIIERPQKRYLLSAILAEGPVFVTWTLTVHPDGTSDLNRFED